MKTCYNCNHSVSVNAKDLTFSLVMRSPCQLEKKPDEGRGYCSMWENTWYDPMDGAEDEGEDDDGEVPLR